ncbi:MAG: OmpA family protein [Patiriisocius sp.]|uniref:OmpA family protein n=1 Tax=Patiriisocius sp. TaxID=2822396 RepID=UPI003EF9D481
MLAVALISSATFAQDSASAFNKWSVELGGGLTKPSSPLAPGYRVKGMAPYQASLGVRYMMNEKVGLRATFGYNDISGDDEGGFLPFETKYYRASLEGVVNLRNVLGFNDFSNSFGLLFHGGGGYSSIDYQEPVDLDENDSAFNLVAGITPQIKLGNRVAFFADVSLISNVGMERSWEGTQLITSNNRRIDDGLLYNVSAGFNIYLGKNDVHADWYSKEDAMMSEIEELQERLSKVETDMIDTDQDGVPDYLDREKNTMSGVAVNTKGIAVDKNNNGIPDEIEPSLDARYLNKNDYNPNSNSTSGSSTVKDLLDKGYVNVYFEFNSTRPQTYSLEAINYLKVYMNENPSATAQLIGYADELGDATYNTNLSEKRAKKVYDILVASGVSESRLSHTGSGEDTSVDKGSSEARQLVRRVTFKLN